MHKEKKKKKKAKSSKPHFIVDNYAILSILSIYNEILGVITLKIAKDSEH